jgi:hypothetical protein
MNVYPDFGFFRHLAPLREIILDASNSVSPCTENYVENKFSYHFVSF